jgi:subtilase family serine protease
MTEWEDYYEILGVSPDSSSKEIKDAYLYKVNILHPDRLSGTSESVKHRAEEDLKKVNRAYDVLKNDQKRKQYYSEWIKHKPGTRRTPKPIPVVNPTVISFSDVEPGETKKATFEVKNLGGPYSKIWISNPDSWVKVIDWESLGTSDELPLQVEIEAEADEWNKSYSEYIEVKLDEEVTSVRVDLQTKVKPEFAESSVAGGPGVGGTKPPSTKPSTGTPPPKRRPRVFYIAGAVIAAIILAVILNNSINKTDSTLPHQADTTNNTAVPNQPTTQSTPTAMDLIIQDITWSPPTPSAGETVTFTVTIKNQGESDAKSSYAQYFIDGTQLDSDPVSSIAAGNTTTETFTWNAEPGSHTISAVADYDSKVPESNENNNEMEVNLSGIPASDLIIQDITWSPPTPSAGETVTFTVTIKNQGVANAGSSRVGYYIDGSYLTNDPVSSIAAGNTTTETFTWNAEPGSHTIKAVADYDSKVPESNENNNEMEIVFSGALLSDLIVQDITWSPPTPSAGETVTFTVTIKNQGIGAAISSRVYYFINGVQEGSDSVTSILVGSTETETFTWNAEPGSHTIKAVADYNSTVPESNETNNEMEIVFSGALLSDLIVQNITWSPPTPSAGETVTFTVTIKNQGTGNSVSSTVRYYIDGLHLTQDSVSSIAAGNTTTETFTWSAEPGSHNIKAVADYNSVVFESNETNNEMEVTFSGAP